MGFPGLPERETDRDKETQRDIGKQEIPVSIPSP